MDLIEGDSVFVPNDKKPSHMVLPIIKAKTTRRRIIILFILIGILTMIVVMVVTMINMHKKIKHIQDDQHVYTDTQVNKLLNHVIDLNNGVNTLGSRVSALDKQIAVFIAVPQVKNGFQDKEKYVPINYLAELELFKSLSPSDQHEYLNMSKEAKRDKYPVLK